jgi:hypothetical protein
MTTVTDVGTLDDEVCCAAAVIRKCEPGLLLRAGAAGSSPV